ncbi:MAG TPA: cell division protein ZapA [Nitrospirota bacterium]|nr:cell division protein ZapA [Nitrospirota bacterium]
MESVQVEIFGQVYSIKGQDDPAYIRELAAIVDAKMKDVQLGTGTVDPHKVAILTALTITDELYRLRKAHESLKATTETATNRLISLTDQLDKA